VGRPFQGRYKALLVEPGHALAQVCHYIHLNPVRAGIVKADKVVAYARSSLPKFVARKDRPDWLEPAVVLDEAGGLADTKAGWQRYLDYLEFLATDEVAQRELVAKRMSRGWCLGSRAFKKEQKQEAARRGADLERLHWGGLEATEVEQERRALWEEKLQAYADAWKVDLNGLSPQKSAPEKVRLAAALKRTTSVSNTWLAQRLKMGAPASASQFVRRFLLDARKASDLERQVSRVKT
jgi:hypothetical protein